jgi:HSP20 family protein
MAAALAQSGQFGIVSCDRLPQLAALLDRHRFRRTRAITGDRPKTKRTMIITKPYPRTAPFSAFFPNRMASLGRMYGSDDLPYSFPRVNIIETANGYRLHLLAPGYSKEDLKLNVENDTLTISAEKKNAVLGEHERYTRHEFAQGNLKRSFRLGEHADLEGISASHVDGVLTITIPKKAENKPAAREIPIG